MNDADITKLAAKLTVSLATKEDIQQLEKKLTQMINKLDKKADTILQFAEEVDDVTVDHEQRIKKLESIPVITHQLKKPKS